METKKKVNAAHEATAAARRLEHAKLLVRHGMDPVEVAKSAGVDVNELLPHALAPGAWDAEHAPDEN